MSLRQHLYKNTSIQSVIPNCDKKILQEEISNIQEQDKLKNWEKISISELK